jgi:hypothetical protein
VDKIEALGGDRKQGARPHAAEHAQRFWRRRLDALDPTPAPARRDVGQDLGDAREPRRRVLEAALADVVVDGEQASRPQRPVDLRGLALAETTPES